MEDSIKAIMLKMLAHKAGRDVMTASGSEWLCNDIVSATREPISPNTVKRLTGVIGGGEHSPSRQTLDIIARYLGFEDYRALERHILSGTSAFQAAEGLVDVLKLAAGSRLVIRWSPDREIRLLKIASGECLVERAANSKLHEGDRLELVQVMVGYPLIINEVIRNNESLGPYTASPEYGVTYVGLE